MKYLFGLFLLCLVILATIAEKTTLSYDLSTIDDSEEMFYDDDVDLVDEDEEEEEEEE